MTVHKVLIANRGEIARRIIRTCRLMGIRTVAVFSDADEQAAFVDEADAAVGIGPAPAAESYLNVDTILAAATSTQCDAVHPGYGFLSEDPRLVTAVEAAGLTFIGPDAATMELTGDKLAARIAMAAAGVPVLPGGPIGAEVAPPPSTAYPLLVKAVGGGGGRGIRVVNTADGLAEAVAAAGREASGAFGIGDLYWEALLGEARHVEVQILGDGHGGVIDLGERECTVQRRRQKVIEEAPSPSIGDDLRAELRAAARAAGTAVGYRGAGTVEFVVGPDDSFAFIELNARLQVEHPVTEAVTGVDLVAWQINIASGVPLPSGDDIPAPHGHAVEARIYAEDPHRGFLPVVGRVHRVDFPALPGLRYEIALNAGEVVTEHYDTLIAKVIASGANRLEAINRLMTALQAITVHGVETNIPLLGSVAADAEFRRGRITTGYLERRLDDLIGDPHRSDTTRIHALIAALSDQARDRAAARVFPGIPSGWRNVPSGPQVRAFTSPDGEVHVVTYRIEGDHCTAAVDGEALDVRLHRVEADRITATINGIRRVYSLAHYDPVTYVDSSLGSTRFDVVPRHPGGEPVEVGGSLLAPLPGTVVAIPVAVGDRVDDGATLIVLEAMKLEHHIKAPHVGTVTAVHVVVGDHVTARDVLVVIDED